MSYLLKKTLLGLPHIVKAASETWSNLRIKVKSKLARSFQHDPCREMDVMSNVNFALPSKNRDLYIYSNQEVITSINTLEGPF